MAVAGEEAHLEPRLVGEISGTFYVPAYQRGYRWGHGEVRRLLDDIWESRDQPYYLQPVVVKRHGDEYELVDGQQRLATLYLILRYMETEGLQSTGANFSMRYETHPDSADYLKDVDPARSQENIDFFHIFEASQCIASWFEAHGAQRQYVANKFYGALFEHVRVIWYEAPPDLDATTLFRRLNVGRIPLTDAELVKASLLSRVRGSVGVTDRALEIAAQWDAIERDLRAPELWAFISGSDELVATHISLLLDTLAGDPLGRDRSPFETFESLRQGIDADPQQFWDEVIDLHSLVLGWHENHDLYHKIGFLVAEGAASLGSLVERSRGKPKSQFEADLDELIGDHLGLSEAGLRALSFGSPKTERALLAMNVETIRQRGVQSNERYSFKEHATGRWSLEHIHAQSAQPLNRAEQWETWLRLHRDALDAFDGASGPTKELLLDRVDQVLAQPPVKQVDFRPLERELIDVLSAGGEWSEGDVDSIANLALLDGSDNSALSNSVFAVKRAVILERDRAGSYIPVCTRNAFLKYYTPTDAQQLHLWGAIDREHYVDELVDTLRPYLRAEDVTS